jgi:sortase A
LDQLKPGDQVILYSIQQQYVYIVSGSQIVAPTQVEVMRPTSESTATLITCYPYMVDNKTHRCVCETSKSLGASMSRKHRLQGRWR